MKTKTCRSEQQIACLNDLTRTPVVRTPPLSCLRRVFTATVPSFSSDVGPILGTSWSRSTLSTESWRSGGTEPYRKLPFTMLEGH